MIKQHCKSGRSRRRQQQGLVLIVTLVLIIPLTVAAGAIMSRNSLNKAMTLNHRDGMRALMVAEAGLAHAMENLPADAFGEPVAGESLWSYSGTAYDADNAAIGSYVVSRVLPDAGAVLGDDYILLSSKASAGSVGAAKHIQITVQKIESALASPPGESDPAAGDGDYTLLAEGPWIFSGNMNLEDGLDDTSVHAADVHSNAYVDISASGVVIDGMVTAAGCDSGVCDGSGMNPDGYYLDIHEDAQVAMLDSSNGEYQQSTPNADHVDIPEIDPTVYAGSATYKLTWDCKVVTVASGEVNDIGDGGGWAGWECSGSSDSKGTTWAVASDTQPPDGTYYVEGYANISGNPGENAVWNVSLAATNSIEVSGNPVYAAYADNMLFTAGNDVKLSGNSVYGADNPQFQGYIGAHMDLQLSGDVYQQGGIVIENGRHHYGQRHHPNPNFDASDSDPNKWGYDLIDFNQVSGNPHIIAGGGSPWLADDGEVVAAVSSVTTPTYKINRWREMTAL